MNNTLNNNGEIDEFVVLYEKGNKQIVMSYRTIDIRIYNNDKTLKVNGIITGNIVNFSKIYHHTLQEKHLEEIIRNDSTDNINTMINHITPNTTFQKNGKLKFKKFSINVIDDLYNHKDIRRIKITFNNNKFITILESDLEEFIDNYKY